MLTSNPLVESWAHFPAAKRRLLRLLHDTNPANLLLLSGDVHYAELSGAIPCLRPILLHVLCVLSATPRAARTAGTRPVCMRKQCQHALCRNQIGVRTASGICMQMRHCLCELQCCCIMTVWSRST